MNTTERNVEIAKMLGWKRIDDFFYVPDNLIVISLKTKGEYLLFHDDWNWIMEAVKFISYKSIYDIKKLQGDKSVSLFKLLVLKRRVERLPVFVSIEGLFLACSEFAAAYNKLTSKQS